MYPIPENITPTDENKLDSYFPLRSKGNEFDWAVVTGIVLSNIFKCQLKNYSVETFRQECAMHFSEILEDENFWPVLDRMYFSTNDVLNISPLFLLFKAQYKSNGRTELGAANWRMSALFASLLGQQINDSDIPQDSNFLESELLKVLMSKLEPTPYKLFPEEHPYLPYLADKFKEDIQFLTTHPKYLIEYLENTLKLYAFSYCSQLALNIKSWKETVPSSKPLYFILDSEKASAERSMVRNHGYKMFSNASEYLFPILSALEVLQFDGPKRPLWKVYQECLAYPENEMVLSDLNAYLAAFRESRKFDMQPGALSIESVFDELMKSATEQFRDEKTKRSDVNRKYMNALEDQIGVDFIVHRGRAGNVLVLNQEQLVLLTNLSIGVYERLRLHELITSFEERGFFLDSHSQQVLVSFYERMGNIERMSDSGDAVYVRKTI